MARHLVLRHLENVSGSLVAKHRDVIAEYARGKCGVYVLYNKGKMYYVGLASNLSVRLNSHLKDHHRDKWDRFSMYLTRNDSHMRELEALLHRVLRPQGNRQIGRLAGSEDLRRLLRMNLKDRYRQELDELMGERVTAARTSRSPSKEGRRSRQDHRDRALAGFVSRATTLKAWYKGYEYSARLLKTGVVRYGGKSYDSPSAAAKAIQKRPVNGWWFWQMQQKSGEWTRLKDLRKGRGA